jgi:hypothetical protein
MTKVLEDDEPLEESILTRRAGFPVNPSEFLIAIIVKDEGLMGTSR